jgi:glycogen operon protein
LTTPLEPSAGPVPALGVTLVEGGAEIAVFAANAERVLFCLFDEAGEREAMRIALPRRNGDVHRGFIPTLRAGARYGLRAEGPFDPAKGHRYDPGKLLVDPHARLLDRPFRYVPELSAPPDAGIDTAAFVPKAIVAPEGARAERLPSGAPAGLLYEVQVKAFGMRHPGIAAPLRGTLAALAAPAAIDHLTRLGVTHVELMPIAAWMDERHLPPLGLANAWGYNPIVFGAPDPRLAPGGMGEVRATVATLHQAGIRVILDVVYNHTGEGDADGPTVSLRGLDNAVYYRHAPDGGLVNDTACGNTLACDRAPVIRLVMDSMRRWVEEAGVDGFRFDLATTLGRGAQGGFSPEAPLIAAMLQDPVLREVELIAEPWDVGEGGYRLGQFPAPFREWNDRFRDDVRSFWKGDGSPGALATRLAGSSDLFQRGHRSPSSSINFVACHDGFTLADLVAYAGKHNEANGEGNRDGTNDNHSWNNGVEGATDDPAIAQARGRDVRALLACLFLSRGTPMLTAGDEMGRTQGGNNNAYCQDNEMSWLDWAHADEPLIGFVASLSRLRRDHACLRRDAFYTGEAPPGDAPDVRWLDLAGHAMGVVEWRQADAFMAVLAAPGQVGAASRLLVVVNRSREPVTVALPEPGPAGWMPLLDSAAGRVGGSGASARGSVTVAGRCVAAYAR